MVNITLSVSTALKKEIEESKLVNWSAVVREAISKKLEELDTEELLDKVLSNPKRSSKKAVRLLRELKSLQKAS